MLYFMDRLRPLVGSKGWDYCVVWRITEDQRFLRFIACCCAGTETGNFIEQNDIMLYASSQFSCKDTVFKHLRTKYCEILSQLPSSVPLESGIYAEAVFSNQPRWHNILPNPDPNKASTDESATRVLIPVLGGLVELFVAKQVPEDQNIVDFIASQCAMPLELDAMVSSSLGLSNNVAEEMAHLGFDKDLAGARSNNFHKPEDINNYQANETGSQMASSLKMICGSDSRAATKNGSNDMDSIRPEAGRSDSISDCSDQIDDENDPKYPKTSGKGQAKNLEAERKRRKKLNENLYRLRALVPIISKLDKAHILVDAIEYVKQLRKQVEELQEELEQDSEKYGVENFANEFGNQDHKKVPNPFVTRASDADNDHEKAQQMEPQVEVTLVDHGKFVIRVFCEYKPGGFVRLLEALSSLGLEVVNVNVTNCRMLVSNVFQVEMNGDCNQILADDLKNSLLELTQIPSGAQWPPPDETFHKSENGIRLDVHYDQYQSLQPSLTSSFPYK